MVDVCIAVSGGSVVDGLFDVDVSTEIASTVTEEFQREVQITFGDHHCGRFQLCCRDDI